VEGAVDLAGPVGFGAGENTDVFGGRDRSQPGVERVDWPPQLGVRVASAWRGVGQSAGEGVKLIAGVGTVGEQPHAGRRGALVVQAAAGAKQTGEVDGRQIAAEVVGELSVGGFELARGRWAR